MHALPTCYICENTTGTAGEKVYQVCLCDVRIHDACFRELVRTVPTHAQNCAVCKNPYITRRALQCAPTARVWSCAAIAFLWGILLFHEMLLARTFIPVAVSAFIVGWATVLALLECHVSFAARVCDADRQERAVKKAHCGRVLSED
jgi:hypothetical protein